MELSRLRAVNGFVTRVRGPEDAMKCPNCRRDAKTEMTRGVIRFRNNYGREIAVPGYGERCLECGHLFHTPRQEVIHQREAERMLKESEEPK